MPKSPDVRLCPAPSMTYRTSQMASSGDSNHVVSNNSSGTGVDELPNQLIKATHDVDRSPKPPQAALQGPAE